MRFCHECDGRIEACLEAHHSRRVNFDLLRPVAPRPFIIRRQTWRLKHVFVFPLQTAAQNLQARCHQAQAQIGMGVEPHHAIAQWERHHEALGRLHLGIGRSGQECDLRATTAKIEGTRRAGGPVQEAAHKVQCQPRENALLLSVHDLHGVVIDGQALCLQEDTHLGQDLGRFGFGEQAEAGSGSKGSESLRPLVLRNCEARAR